MKHSFKNKDRGNSLRSLRFLGGTLGVSDVLFRQCNGNGHVIFGFNNKYFYTKNNLF